MDVREYFQSHENYFWEWTTDKDIHDNTGYNENNLISIPNVGTIAYRAYIIEVLKEFQLIGLPALSPLLLALYATNEGYLDLKGIKIEMQKNPMTMQKYIGDWIKPAFQFLETLESLPSNYKKGRNRILLLQTIFSNEFDLVSLKQSEYILNEYLRNPQKIANSAQKNELTVCKFSKDLRILASLHNKFPTATVIIEAMKGNIKITDLDDEVIQEETTIENNKDFIQELIEDPKTFQVGSLIKRIWSGLKIPMRHLSPGEQPIGGISDMTNKGELSRMLLSEFANEDEIFMNRVANNEALYIQREIPPEENIFERIILIDTSLKNWGTPKILAFASAIAVIKHPKAHSECKVFALGQTNVLISLDKVEEVVDNLNQVSPVLEVSQALDRFFQEEHKEKDLEVFFITHQENLANENIQRTIHENRDRLKFLVTTSVDGELNFYKHHKGTRKHIQKVLLPLKELWANPPQRRKNRENDISYSGKRTDLPLNYPILFPTPTHKIAQFLYEGEFFILSNKKQLLRTYLSDNYYNRDYYDYYKTYHGCEVLMEDISVKPKGQFALAKNKQQQFILCQYQPDKKLISKLNLNTKEYSELNLTGQHIPADSRLTYFSRNFYLFHAQALNIFKINIDGNISIESVKNDAEIQKNDTKVVIEVLRLDNSGIKISGNFGKIGINAKNNLVVSGNELSRSEESSVSFLKNKFDIKILAEQNKNKFTFPDGSEIITDSRGMLTFKSSNGNIPTFYIPSAEKGFLSLSTNVEFGGSEYYLPENTLLKVKKMEDMYSDYLEKFINQILEYGA
ncbi:hypothetical protein [Chryseobacterium polytrichastri]|uniref:Uncharacterized protein n=1 Tax=Chryseobacterium polytrichastri TaxID=1302687 RepID=A0A1M6WLF0_9FLAO|nr:hypothetical protein [Chryseobacterium polytrichastri]SHK94548.1 hypothetical protein SAMN05444267_1009157 [Chryseobacterium polytrichastri]